MYPRSLNVLYFLYTQNEWTFPLLTGRDELYWIVVEALAGIVWYTYCTYTNKTDANRCFEKLIIVHWWSIELVVFSASHRGGGYTHIQNISFLHSSFMTFEKTMNITEKFEINFPINFQQFIIKSVAFWIDTGI